MANYKETQVTGSEYTRCNTINICNPLGKTPSITYGEERVTVLSSDRNLFEPAGQIVESFDPTKTINLLDPETGADTGQTMTYGQMYVALYSAYMAQAFARDAAPVEV